MKVIPAVDVRGGKSVQLVGGKPGTERVEIEDVAGLARKWQRDGAEMIHVIDLDSANGVIVNNARITKPTKIKPGDEIIVGENRFFLREVDPDTPDDPTAIQLS